MKRLLTAIYASGRAVSLCWLLLFLAIGCGSSTQSLASFTKPSAHLASMAEYGPTGRGTREGQGSLQAGDHATLSTNALDQVTGRQLSGRGFGILGFADKKAKVFVNNAVSPTWRGLTVDPNTGGFFGWWSVGNNFGGGAGVARITSRVRGVVPPTSPGGVPAIAEVDLTVVVPPMSEALAHGAVGNLEGDAFWTYQWNSLGRLTGMVRKTGTFLKEGVVSETVDFGYDADGRRTSKEHTTTFPDRVEKVKSVVLWTGWLPILELRTVNDVYVGRRWFQWGADLSGTLEGAGGIGGLLAIIEENAAGTVTRTLTPVQDGLGNITAVLNAANGKTVARYDYGPFGEPLGASGEVDACPFRWQTKWFDAESEHYYFGYRHYDPRLGRWLSRDPLGEAGGFNLYAYCGNDPVNRNDPLGLSAYNRLLDSAAEDLAGGRYIKGYGKTTVVALWEAFSFRAAFGVGEVQDLYEDGEITGAQAISSASIKVARSTTEAALTLGGGHFAGGFVNGGSTILRQGLRAGSLGGTYGGSEAILDIGAERGVSAVEGREYAGTWEGDALKIAVSTATGFSVGAVLGTGAGAIQKSVNKAANTSPNIVYRALTQADAEAIAAGRGLTAKAPSGTWTAAEHVANSGPGVGGVSANSPWISTTSRLDVAQAYNSGNGVVAIDLNKVTSFQAQVWKSAPRVNGVQGLPFHRSFWAQETTIFQGIPAEAILGPVEYKY